MASAAAVLSALAVLGGCASAPEGDPEAPASQAEPEQKPAAQPKPQPTAKPSAPAPKKAPAKTPAVKGPPEDKPGGGGILEELTKFENLRVQERKAVSENYYRTGKVFYEKFQYRDAAENFRKAVEANPDNLKARYLLNMSLVLLGENAPEIKTSTELLSQQRKIRQQQQQQEIQRLYDQGVGLMADKKFDQAIGKFEQILEKIKWSSYSIDPGDLETQARTQIIAARVKKREQEMAERQAIEEKALQQALENERRVKADKKRKVDLLVKRATDQLSRKQFDKAEETLKEIEETDPNNQNVSRLRDIATFGRHANQNARSFALKQEHETLNEEANREVLIPFLDEDGARFPDKEYWNRVKKRGVGVTQPEEKIPEWVADYQKILRTRRISINFNDTPFSDVITFLQDITGLNITVSPDIDQEEIRVTLSLKNIALQNAFNLLLSQTDHAMVFRDETIKIVPKDQAKGNFYLDILDVQDILSQIPDFPGPQIKVRGDGGGGGGGGAGGAGGGQTLDFGDGDEAEEEGSVIDPEKLVELIRGSTGEDNWEDPASIEAHRGQLIVFQTPELQKAVRSVLENLRKNNGLFVQIETRFITLQNDFLRDIGVDYRDLGQGNPVFGTTVELDPSAVGQIRSSQAPNGGFNPNIIGVGRQLNGRGNQLGPNNPATGNPTFGQNFAGGRLENVIDGTAAGFLAGMRLNGTSVQASGISKGTTVQATFLDPIQVNAILRLDEENAQSRQLTAPTVTAANRQRVYTSIVTQRAYIADYELSSGGTGLTVAEVADPIIETFQEGIVLDVRPTVSSDRKYITLDVKPTLAVLVGGQFTPIPVSLGTQTAAAINVVIEVPTVLLQEAFTSVTIPDGGTALLGGFRNITESRFVSSVPFLDTLPIVNTIFKRDAEIRETSSLMILIKAKMISLREQERQIFGND